MSWEPANRLPNAPGKQLIAGLLVCYMPLDMPDELLERRGRDEPNKRGSISPVRTLPLLGQKTTSFID